MDKMGGPKRFRPKAMLIVGLHLAHIFLTPCREEEKRRSKPQFTSLLLNKMDCFFLLFEMVLSRQDRASNGHEAAVMNENEKEEKMKREEMRKKMKKRRKDN